MSVVVSLDPLVVRSRTDIAPSCSYRPLPDERPRQSVANLIGRFEQQGKRQASPAVPVVPRSSSVSSQIAGDAAKEEVKEKREWPPKPLASADIKPVAATLSSSPTSSMTKALDMSPQPIPDPAPPADKPTTPILVTPEPVKSPPSKGKAVGTGKSTPARRTVASPAKTRSPVRNTASAKSSVSSPPKTSLQSSVSQPLRPQHTGQSVASNPSTTRQARPVPRTAPSTPSRPKSSAAQNPAIARPKTPSSGLFAPTAASLARSRNANPPLPPPVKKVTLSSEAAERLSKPTAASLSKARTPVPSVPSPARVVKSTSTGAHGSIRGPSKLKIERTPVKLKEANSKEGSKTGPTSASPEPSRGSDLVADHVENGQESGTATFSDVGSPEDTHGCAKTVSDPMHDPAADEEVHSDPGVHPEQQADEHRAEEEAHSLEHVTQNDPEQQEAASEHEQVHMEVQEDSVPEPDESHVGEVTTNGDSLKVGLTAPGIEIEDIVNLLEGTSLSKPRPQSIVSIPDEIPDEY